MKLIVRIYTYTHPDSYMAGPLVSTKGAGVKLIDNTEDEVIYGLIDTELSRFADAWKLLRADQSEYGELSIVMPANHVGDALKANNLQIEDAEYDQGEIYFEITDASLEVRGISGLINGSQNIFIPTPSGHYYNNWLSSLVMNNKIIINSAARVDAAPFTNTINQAINAIYQPPKQEEKRKEPNNFMKNFNVNLNLRCGRVPREFALSFDGHICFKGKYFDKNVLNDTCGLTFDVNEFLFIIPSATITKGDVIYDVADGTQHAYYYDGAEFIDLATGMKAEFVPTKVFGMTFYNVVKNLVGNIFGTPAQGANPMANMLPLLLLSKDGCGDNSDLFTMMLLAQNGGNLFGATPAPTPAAK